MHNAEIGTYLEDRWQPAKGWLVEPGLRFDWDEIVRRPLVAPRVAAVYSPPGDEDKTKISAGIGLYYEHTQLEYLAQTYAGIRYDTVLRSGRRNSGWPGAGDGVHWQRSPATRSASLELERGRGGEAAVVDHCRRQLYGETTRRTSLRLPTKAGRRHFRATICLPMGGRITTAQRSSTHDGSLRTDTRCMFRTRIRRRARMRRSITCRRRHLLGPQQTGPLAWDTPNRVISWGWLPIPIAKLKNRWDLVYLIDRHTGFPFTAVNAAQQVVGAAGGQRFPDFTNFSPGLEWKFHFRGQYWGLRGVMENATGSRNPAVVNNVVDSPEFGTFSEFQGRAFTARIRLIGTK